MKLTILFLLTKPKLERQNKTRINNLRFKIQNLFINIFSATPKNNKLIFLVKVF